MKLKSSVRYQLWDYGKAMAAFYVIIVLAVIIYLRLSGTGQPSAGTRSFAGIEVFTILFSFIVGLYAFNNCFFFFIQSGISRRTMFRGRCVAVVLMSFISALAGQLLVMICRLIDADIIFGIYQRLYHGQLWNKNSFQAFAGELMLNFVIYILFGCVGYFTAIMYYRMSRIGRFGVSIGVPAVILWMLPNLDRIAKENPFSLAQIESSLGGFGTEIVISYGLVIICILISVVIGASSWYLLKGAVVRG